MVSATSDLPAPVRAYLARSESRSTRVVPLTGDASDRRYFRVMPAEGGSYVLAVHGAPFEYDALPFVNVAGLLAGMPVPVPAILGSAPELGVLALEDLGDVTLQAHLGTRPAAAHLDLYRQAVELIDVIQRRGRDLADARYVPFAISFDVAKLTWEFDFFIKHFLEAYRGVSFEPDDREALRAEGVAIAEELAAEPRVLCHRDYHSRNLMVHRGRLAVIDFQDARMGPDTYDLASLLRDSYVDLPADAVDDLLAHYLSIQRRTAERDVFRRRFDLASLQRNLKALGTFGFQAATRLNPVYIQYIPRTLGYTRENLHKYPRFAGLARRLAARVPELQ